MDTPYAKGPLLIGFCPWDSQFFFFFVVVIDLALHCKPAVSVALMTVQVKPLFRQMFINCNNFRLMQSQ